MPASDSELNEEDVIRALIIDAQNNPDTFNEHSVKSALDAADMPAIWNEASDDNEYTEEEGWKRALNTVCVAARSGDPFNAETFQEELDGEGFTELWDEVAAGDEETPPDSGPGDDEDDDDDDDEDEEDEGTDDPDELSDE